MTLKDWIAPARTALLLVDCQVDFAAPEGSLGRQGVDMHAAQAAIRQAAVAGGIRPLGRIFPDGTGSTRAAGPSP